MHNQPDTFDLKQLLSTLRRRAPIVLLCTLVMTAAAFAITSGQPKKYTASAALNFSTSSLSQQIAGLPTGGVSGSSLLAQHANDVELVRLGSTAAATAAVLGEGLTEKKVKNDVAVSASGESGVVTVAATARSPQLAARIANVYVNQFIRAREATERRYFRAALQIVRRQLAEVPPKSRGLAGAVALQNRAAALKLLAELGSGDVQVAQVAKAPSSPSAPKTARNTLLGLVIGLLIGLGLVYLLEILDRTVKGAQELERAYALPLIGAVPQSRSIARRAARTVAGETRLAPLPPAEAEAFALIRAHLRFFDVDRPLRTLVIASAAPEEGKSTIAGNLAESAARTGARVLLVEADLRRPTLDRELGLAPSGGLAGVLVGSLTLAEATQGVVLEDAPDGAGGLRRLDVLLAGELLPPNAAELIESDAFASLLGQAASIYDLVIIDTPPLLAVADGMPLLKLADGILVVGRVGHTRRDTAAELRRVLDSSGASALGVIANSMRPELPGYYSGGQRRSSGSRSAGEKPPAPTPA